METVFEYNGKLALYSNWLWNNDVIKYENYKANIKRGKITVLRRSAPNQPAIIEYKLPYNIKEKVDNKLKNMGELPGIDVSKEAAPKEQPQPCFFEAYIKPDAAAMAYFEKLGCLSRTTIQEYYLNAIVLNAAQELIIVRSADRKGRGKTGRKDKGMFKSIISELAAVLSLKDEEGRPKYPHTLPLSVRNLRPLLKEYRDANVGYAALVHGNYGNKNTEKIGDDGGEWLVARWAAHVPTRVTLYQLFEEYNRVAELRKWKPLRSENSIRNYLNRPEVKPLWYGARYGELKFKEKYTRKHKTILPEMRDALWYGDGTKLNYYYLNEKGAVSTINVYEVIDVYSECLLGYHISENEDFATQYNAYRNAIHFSGYKPYQISFDNQGGHKKLAAGDFFKKLAHLSIPTQPYNGNSKTIESIFGRYQSQFLHKEWFFTGQNITAKKQESHPNIEFINANSKNLKSLQEIERIYRMRRNEWNNAPHPDTGISRLEMYRNSANEKSVKIEMQDMIFMFGVRAPKPITYSSNGIIMRVKGKKYQYEVLDGNGNPDFDFLKNNVDREFIVEYDPEDMSAVSLFVKAHGKDDVIFVGIAHKYIEVHRAKQDQDDFDFSFLKAMEAKNKELRIETQEQIEELLEQHNFHPAQYGLNMPKPKGINSKKSESIGQIRKRESNLVPELDDYYNRY